MISRLLLALVATSLVALAARRARSLSASGAVAAVCVGTAACAAGWGWGVVLVAYFVASSALSRWRAAAKERRTQSIVAKGGARDAWQVLANGGVFAMAGVAGALTGWPHAAAVGFGALAASAADTWATEIGTLARGTPRSIVTLRHVPAGTSGGVTLAGWIGAALGAAFVATTAMVAGPGHGMWISVVVAGVAGAAVDSLIGATVQQVRHCPACGRDTERLVHDCGTPTVHARGVRWLDNDAVNLASTLAGAAAAWLLAR